VSGSKAANEADRQTIHAVAAQVAGGFVALAHGVDDVAALGLPSRWGALAPDAIGVWGAAGPDAPQGVYRLAVEDVEVAAAMAAVCDGQAGAHGDLAVGLDDSPVVSNSWADRCNALLPSAIAH